MGTSINLLIVLLLLLSHTTHEQEEEEEDNPITRFRKYLRINTAHPNPNYTAAVSYLLSVSAAPVRSTVLEFAPSKPLLLLTWDGSDPSLPSVLLNSHLDSVPADPSRWSHPPFSAALSPSGLIFARGSQDDKSISLQQLEALRRLASRSLRPTRTLHLSFVPDEEIGGSHGAAKFVASDVFRALNVGFMLDEGQANPGDDFRVFYADRCPWELTIRAKGPPGHGSRMFDGAAVENLMKSVEIIARFRETQFDLVKAGLAANSEVVSVNLVYLNAGIALPTGFVMNMQPSEAVAGFDVRLPPTADPELMRRRIAEEWAPAVRNMTYTILEKGPTRDIHGHPMMTPTDDSNPWWVLFDKAITAVGGKLAKPEILSSTTDSRFVRQLGIPALGFSPMTNTPILLHDHNEHLKDTVYLRGIEVYESIISTLCSFEPEASH